MLALYGNVGALLKCWRAMKMLSHSEKVGALWKCWRPIEMLAPYWNVGALWKSQRPMKMLAPYGKVGALWKCQRPMKKLAPYENVSTPYTTRHKNIQHLWDVASSALADSSFSGGVVPSACCCWVPAIASWPAYMGALTPYWSAMVIPAKCRRSTKMLTLYSKVGTLLKSLKNGQSATRRHIKKR